MPDVRDIDIATRFNSILGKKVENYENILESLFENLYHLTGISILVMFH